MESMVLDSENSGCFFEYGGRNNVRKARRKGMISMYHGLLNSEAIKEPFMSWLLMYHHYLPMWRGNDKLELRVKNKGRWWGKVKLIELSHLSLLSDNLKSATDYHRCLNKTSVLNEFQIPNGRGGEIDGSRLGWGRRAECNEFEVLEA